MPERWSEGLAMTQHWPVPFLLTSCMLKRLSFISLWQNESSSVWYIFVRIRKAHLGSQDTHRHPIFRGHGKLAHAHLGFQAPASELSRKKMERIPFYVGRIPFIVVVLLVFCWGGRNLRLYTSGMPSKLCFNAQIPSICRLCPCPNPYFSCGTKNTKLQCGFRRHFPCRVSIGTKASPVSAHCLQPPQHPAITSLTAQSLKGPRGIEILSLLANAEKTREGEGTSSSSQRNE